MPVIGSAFQNAWDTAERDGRPGLVGVTIALAVLYEVQGFDPFEVADILSQFAETLRTRGFPTQTTH